VLFFFQAEDGIRDFHVTGVQTCALPIFSNLFKGFLGLFIGGIERKNPEALLEVEKENLRKQIGEFNKGLATHAGLVERLMSQARSEERRVGKECSRRGSQWR